MGRPCAAQEVGEHGLGPELRRGEPQPTRAGEARVQSCDPARAEELDRRPARRGTAARSCRRRADGPRPASTPPGQLAREVHDDRVAVGQPAVDRGRNGRRRVTTTTRSPGARNSPSSGKRAWTGAGVADAHEQPDVVAAAATGLGRLVRLVRGVEHEVESGGGQAWCRSWLPRCRGREGTCLVPSTRDVALDEGDEAGNALGRLRSIGDVLAGERVLVHLGAHVAGVDDEHPTPRLLDGEDPARVLERGLRRAVPAPPLVRPRPRRRT